MTEGFLNITLAVTLGAIIPSIILGAIVLFRGRAKLNQKIFTLSALCIILWAIANYLSLQPTLNVLFWVRIVMLFAVLLQYIFLLLVRTFSKETINLKRFRFWGPALLGVAAMIATQTPYLFTHTEMLEGEAVPVPGPLMPLFAFAILLFFALGGANLVRNIRNSSGDKRAQLMFSAVGYFSMFILLIFTQFLAVAVFQNTSFIKFGPIFTLPFLFLTTYAIFKHNLFNIRVIATEVFTLIIILIVSINIFLSGSIGELALNILLFILVTIFGFLLIRGTLREITELERLSKAKSDFVSIVSHQLRTPLTAIKGFTSMIKEGSGSEEDRRDWVDKTYEINERMIRLVNDILNISRIERGKLQYNFQDTNIINLIEGVVTETHIQSEERGIVLNWEKPTADVPLIRADEAKLRQVILNLVDNAIHYTDKGHINVRLLYLSELNRIKITVQDTGIGISKEDLKNLFDRFSRGEGGQKINSEGLGLGLYVAQSIIKAHNGKIWAESEGINKGSRFYIELPVH